MAKVIIHSLLFSPDATANSYIISDLALELQRYGHEVNVITTTPHYGVLKENLDSQPLINGKKSWYKLSDFHGIKCCHVVVPREKGNMIQRVKTYLRFHYFALKIPRIEKMKADVVITESPPLSIGIINGILSKRLDAKSIYIVQDLFPDGPIVQGKIKNPIVISILRFLEKCVYKNNDCVVSISEGIRKIINDRVPADTKQAIIQNFVDTNIYQPTQPNEEYIEQYNLRGKFVISYVGNIGNAHDLSPIIACADQLKNANIVFLIAGNGIKLEYYKEIVKQKKLDNVIFLGYVKREETVKINSVSDLCLVMLADHIRGTSFPSKIYTIMGMGKPVLIVCSDQCDAGQYVIDNCFGWWVKSGDNSMFCETISNLMENRERLASFGENAYQVVMMNNTKEIVGKLYNKLIEELICK